MHTEGKCCHFDYKARVEELEIELAKVKQELQELKDHNDDMAAEARFYDHG